MLIMCYIMLPYLNYVGSKQVLYKEREPTKYERVQVTGRVINRSGEYILLEVGSYNNKLYNGRICETRDCKPIVRVHIKECPALYR